VEQYRQQSSTLVGEQRIPDLSAVQSLTIPDRAETAQVQAQGGNVRFGLDADPGSAAGGLIYDGNWHDFVGKKLGDLRFVEGESGAGIYVLYGRG